MDSVRGMDYGINCGVNNGTISNMIVVSTVVDSLVLISY